MSDIPPDAVHVESEEQPRSTNDLIDIVALEACHCVLMRAVLLGCLQSSHLIQFDTHFEFGVDCGLSTCNGVQAFKLADS